MFLLYAALSSVILLFFAYMIYKAHDDELKREVVCDQRLSKSFDGYTIFFIADIHRRTIKEHTLNQIDDEIHLVLIAGDLRERGVPYKRTRNNIVKLKRWNAPIYFVMGNNDYEGDYNRLQTILKNEGVTILNDRYDVIRKDGIEMELYGFDFYRNNEERPAFDWSKKPNTYRILLTHTPDSFYDLDGVKHEINLVFAGHTHGGQIRFGPIALYPKGGISKDKQTYVIVTEGYGYSLLPFRLQTNAQCHIITLKKKEDTSSKMV